VKGRRRTEAVDAVTKGPVATEGQMYQDYFVGMQRIELLDKLKTIPGTSSSATDLVTSSRGIGTFHLVDLKQSLIW
jgi:hypothetical protein